MNKIDNLMGLVGSSAMTVVRAAPWVPAATPEEGDRQLVALLTQLLGSDVVLIEEMRFPDGGAAYSRVVGARVNCEDKTALARCLATVEGALGPSTHDQCEEWLAMLEVALAGANRSQDYNEVKLAVYAGALTKYPPDVVKAVCKNLAMAPRRGDAWFPKLPNLTYECEKMTATREALKASLVAESMKTLGQRTKQKLLNDAYDLEYEASKMSDELINFPRPDADRAAELKAAIPVTRAKARELRVEARQMA